MKAVYTRDDPPCTFRAASRKCRRMNRVLNHGAQQVGIQSVQRATHCNHPAIFWICQWTLFVNWGQLGLFPRPGDVGFRDEQLEHCSDVRGQYIDILPFTPPYLLLGTHVAFIACAI
eukprot:1161275-Pelagomonas_calceolata.AAC.1